MTLITDGLLLAAAVFAGAYCFVLSRRLRALRDLDSGLGAAIMQMTRSLEDARRALEEAKATSRDGNKELKDLIIRAEAASGQLRILLSATRDLGATRSPVKSASATRTWTEDDALPQGTQPAAPAARREPPPLAAPRTPAPALDLLERGTRRAAQSTSLLRRRVPSAQSEDDLLAALADFAGTRI